MTEDPDRHAIDRSKILAEAYPGATNDIETLAAVLGGWRCEQHPDLPWPHDNCAGPGFLPEKEDR